MASLRLAILAKRQTCLNKINERAAFERFKKNARPLESAFILCLYRFSHEKSHGYLTNFSYLSKKQNGT